MFCQAQATAAASARVEIWEVTANNQFKLVNGNVVMSGETPIGLYGGALLGVRMDKAITTGKPKWNLVVS